MRAFVERKTSILLLEDVFCAKVGDVVEGTIYEFYGRPTDFKPDGHISRIGRPYRVAFSVEEGAVGFTVKDGIEYHRRWRELSPLELLALAAE